MNRSNKKKLIEALVSMDKDRVRKALSISLPVKWITIEIDSLTGTISYLDKNVSKDAMKVILDEASKDYQVKLIVMNTQRNEDKTLEETWAFHEPELIINFKECMSYRKDPVETILSS